MKIVSFYLDIPVKIFVVWLINSIKRSRSRIWYIHILHFLKQTCRLLYLLGKINYFNDLYDDLTCFLKWHWVGHVPLMIKLMNFTVRHHIKWLVFVKLNFQKLLLKKQWFYTLFSFNKLHFIVWNCFSNIYVLLYNEYTFANMFVILKTYQILLQIFPPWNNRKVMWLRETGNLISSKER